MLMSNDYKGFKIMCENQYSSDGVKYLFGKFPEHKEKMIQSNNYEGFIKAVMNAKSKMGKGLFFAWTEFIA